MIAYDPTIDAHVSRLESAGLVTAGVGAAAVLASTASIGLPCPLLSVTGVPCPACGMTRVGSALARGDVGLALATDPAGVVVVAVLGALALLAVLTSVGRRPALPWLRAPVITATLAAALAVHWATTLTTGGFVDS